MDLFQIIEDLKTVAPEWAERIERAMDEGKMVHIIESPCSKVKYGHEDTARRAAQAMHSKTGDSYETYYCDECRAWHVGHSRWM